MEQLNVANKKLKTARDNIERDYYGAQGIALRDLPNEALAYVASYLARPSKALFAVALSNGASMNDATNAILSLEQWKALDFGEIDATLAAKITDDYLRKILLCIGANAKLNTLKLTGCVNITGAGLDPLRGSVVLEKIDLSLVAEHKSPVLDPEPLISCEHVLPILDSIIGREGNALCRLDFPKSWRGAGNITAGNTAFHEFLPKILNDEISPVQNVIVVLNSAHSNVNNQVSELMSYSDLQIRGSIALLLRSTAVTL